VKISGLQETKTELLLLTKFIFYKEMCDISLQRTAVALPGDRSLYALNHIWLVAAKLR
jgi:hypothetical protein